MTSLPNIDQSLSRIRGWRSASGWTVSRLASEAGLAESTLRFLDSGIWNPTAETLRKLEAVIPPGWQPGDPVPPLGGPPESGSRAADPGEEQDEKIEAAGGQGETEEAAPAEIAAREVAA